MRNIEDLTNPLDIKEEIKYQNQNFNLKDFYLKKVYNEGKMIDGAISIITKEGTINCFAKTSHFHVAEKIYKLLDDGFSGFEIDKDMLWQYQCTNRGDICIQLCNEMMSCVFLPETITYKQFEDFQYFVFCIQEINEQLLSQGLDKLLFAIYDTQSLTISYRDNLKIILDNLKNKIVEENLPHR